MTHRKGRETIVVLDRSMVRTIGFHGGPVALICDARGRPVEAVRATGRPSGGLGADVPDGPDGEAGGPQGSPVEAEDATGDGSTDSLTSEDGE